MAGPRIKHRVAYLHDPEVGQYYYGPSHPMKPHRMQLAHQLIVGYELHNKMMCYKPHKASDKVRGGLSRGGGGGDALAWATLRAGQAFTRRAEVAHAARGRRPAADAAPHLTLTHPTSRRVRSVCVCARARLSLPHTHSLTHPLSLFLSLSAAARAHLAGDEGVP